jgi:hypothetical protein
VGKWLDKQYLKSINQNEHKTVRKLKECVMRTVRANTLGKCMGMILGLVLLVMVPAGMCGETLHVGPGLDPSLPGNYITISSALSDATDGDVVRVESNTYSENITIPAGVILIGSGNDTIINGDVYPYARATLIAFYITKGIYLRGDNVNCKDLVLDGTFGAALGGDYQSRKNIHIENCSLNYGIVKRNGTYGSYNAPYTVYINTCTIINCIIKNRIDQMTGSSYFSGNEIHIDENQKFTVGSNNIFRNNLIVFEDINSPNSGYLQSNTIIEHNTIIRPSDLPTPNNLWKNNIIYSDADPVIDIYGNLVGRPGFVDYANKDYHLAPGAAAENAGIGIDDDESVADIGMYGGVFADIWDEVIPVAGKPSVGHIIVTPNPVVPGEPLRLRFTAQSNP